VRLSCLLINILLKAGQGMKAMVKVRLLVKGRVKARLQLDLMLKAG
jgi:hypothetical protein